MSMVGADTLITIGEASVGLTFIAVVGRFVYKLHSRLEDFYADWQGAPPRPGVPARPGVMQRLEHIEESVATVDRRTTAVEKELHPNGGSSLRDSTNRTEAGLRHLNERLDRHLETCASIAPAVRQDVTVRPANEGGNT